MAGTSTATRADIDDALLRIDAVLDELEQLAAADSGEEPFYGGLFERLTALGCGPLAIWHVAADGEMQLERHSQGKEVEDESLRMVVGEVVRGGEPKLLAGTGGAEQICSIVVPWKLPAAGEGALQTWLGTGVTPDLAKSYAPLLAAVGEIVGTFRTRCAERRLRAQVEQRSRLDAFTTSLHESLEMEDVAYRIASDGRIAAGCDRVAVAIRLGGTYKIQAVSGAEHIHRRAESVRELASLCRAVAATCQPLWQEGGPQDLPPQISSTLADYLELSPALALAVIPLVPGSSENGPPARPLAVLVFEQYAKPFDPASRGLIEGMLAHCRIAIQNALLLRSIPAHRLWLALGREGWLSKWALRGLAATILLAAVVGALIAIPADLEIKARGELQPAVRHEVFAPRDGVVTSLFVDHGASVKRGEKLLELRSPDLDLERQRVAGELETVRKQLAAAQAERLQIRPGEPDAQKRQRRLTADEEQFAEQVRGLEARQTLLAAQERELTVTSPVAGEVITWNAEERLATRPLRRGDALLSIADEDGPWQLELRVPSRRAGRLVAAHKADQTGQKVAFVLTSAPTTHLTGTVQQVAERVEIDQSGESHLLVTVSVDREALPVRVPGATVSARVVYGRGSLGQAWFQDLWDAFRLWIAF